MLLINRAQLNALHNVFDASGVIIVEYTWNVLEAAVCIIISKIIVIRYVKSEMISENLSSEFK